MIFNPIVTETIMTGSFTDLQDFQLRAFVVGDCRRHVGEELSLSVHQFRADGFLRQKLLEQVISIPAQEFNVQSDPVIWRVD